MKSNLTDVIDAPVALVCKIVTDNKNFQWREEVENIKLLENSLIEYYMENGKENLNRITEELKFVFKRKYISKTSF